LVLENHTSVEVGQLLLYPVKVQLSGKGPTTYNMSLTGVNDVLSLCHVRLSSQPPGISMVTLGTTENQLISTANFTYNPGKLLLHFYDAAIFLTTSLKNHNDLVAMSTDVGNV